MDSRGLLDLIIGRIPGISAAERIKLGEKFDREADIAVLSREDVGSILGRSLDKRPWTMDALRTQAERDAAALRLRGIGMVSYRDPAYPPLLREIYDPPAALFFRGPLPDPERPLLAMVGTRRPSGAGAAQAYDLARALARGGLPVVSGLALGIDAMAHRGSLEGGAPTAAVLGSSPDEVYPASNRVLARRIVEGGGVLLSEYPPGTGPQKWYFPARNRIIAGLARWVVIVEAPASSGALITAQFALDQGRELLVASSGLSSPLGEGTRKLAGEGARVVSGAEEILREWGAAESEKAREPVPAASSGTARGAAMAASLAKSLSIEL
jgi:DNA processing protein